jgi:hypothetical protein
MLVFNGFHCNLKCVYKQLSTSLHDAFEWAATKILAPLDVGLCSLGMYYCLSMALFMASQVLVSTFIKEGFKWPRQTSMTSRAANVEERCHPPPPKPAPEQRQRQQRRQRQQHF